MNHKTDPYTNLHYDVVILGAGGAGLTCAVHLKMLNPAISVACVSKVKPLQSHTIAAAGGINAALGNYDNDKWEYHAFDTINASAGLADKDSVDYMCKNAPQAIEFLEGIGVTFSRDNSGKIEQRPYGGQKLDYGTGDPAKRACYNKDKTGSSIQQNLYLKAKELGVEFFVESFVLDMQIDNYQFASLTAIHLHTSQVLNFKANVLVIASGGAGQMYKTTTSANICTADGSAMLLKKGFYLQDMEFVQFHPTGLPDLGILVTEAARGEGGYLTNSIHEKFMQKYSPEYKDLASRDIVAKAIATEIQNGNGCGPEKDYVLLHLHHLSAEIVTQKLPSLHENIMLFCGIDIIKSPIPVAPSAHYIMGGIPTANTCNVITLNSSKQEVLCSNVYAVGEAACVSVHGANRLGCNSLLELIVFGKLTAETILSSNFGTNSKSYNFGKSPYPAQESLNPLNQKSSSLGEKDYFRKVISLRNKTKHTMQLNVGVFRSHKTLSRAQSTLNQIEQEMMELEAVDPMNPYNLATFLETQSITLQAKCVTKAALWRKESRGSHYRVDFPTEDAASQLHFMTSLSATENPFARKVRS